MRIAAATFAWMSAAGFVGASVIALLALTWLLGDPDALAMMAAYFVGLLVVCLAGMPALIVGSALSGRRSDPPAQIAGPTAPTPQAPPAPPAAPCG